MHQSTLIERTVSDTVAFQSRSFVSSERRHLDSTLLVWNRDIGIRYYLMIVCKFRIITRISRNCNFLNELENKSRFIPFSPFFFFLYLLRVKILELKSNKNSAEFIIHHYNIDILDFSSTLKITTRIAA